MAIFLVTATRNGETRRFWYDNQTSALTHEDGSQAVVGLQPRHFGAADTSMRGKDKARFLKIQLGLMCNYACSYCSQRFVPRAEQTGPREVAAFLARMPDIFAGGNSRVQFWGGEPFVYWKTLKPLAEGIRERYPEAKLGIVTNGSLLTREKIDWLDRLGFTVGISHDGPGHHVRGPDPLDDPKMLDVFRYAVEKLGGRMSFNAMVHKDNPSRAAINAFFVDRFGAGIKIGEGGFVDAYDEGGLSSSAPNDAWGRQFARSALDEIRAGKTQNMNITEARSGTFIESVLQAKPASALGQKCGMDRRDTMAIDLRGNVLTCQNLSVDAVAGNGQSHCVGSWDDLPGVDLSTSLHWSQREGCKDCPMLHICKGSCMFLAGEQWEASCRSSYFDAVPFFAAGFEYLTGFSPVEIDGPLPESRKRLFAESGVRRVIPIKAV